MSRLLIRIKNPETDMKRLATILILGLLVAIAAYCTVYFVGTAQHRVAMESPAPELTWLKKEFNLSEAEFDRISKLHEAYMPQCMEMCRKIDAKNAEIKELLAKTDALTPEIEQKLNEAAQLRVECQKRMLQHFLTVSKAMPAEQGKRYFTWVQDRTFLPGEAMQGHE